MRHWKYLLIVAVVAGGYWTGYAMKRDRQTQARPTVVTPPAAVVVAPMDPTPLAVDPSLILPPVPAQGAMIDIPIDDIRKQFREKAGLKENDDAKVSPEFMLRPWQGPELDLSKMEPIPFRRDDGKTPSRSGHDFIAKKTGPDWDKPGTGSGKPGSGWEATGIPGTPGYEEPAVRLPLGPPRLDDPPHPDPVRPDVIRLPAPSNEPVKLDPPLIIDPPAKVDPTVKRVIHRQITPWMFVNERDLRLNFDVTKQGSSGIKSVELWARRSSEHNYECVDRMLGDKAPFITRLWSEGNYELRMVFESGSGGRTRMPTRNDLPDLYVCLDTTAPLVELLPASAAENGVVNLRWKASDANLAEQPICLQYSVDGVKWDTVGEKDCWLPNAGTYAWKVPDGLPHEVHLRVQARDRAGNVGKAQSPSKFSVDLVMPEGKISGVVERGPEPRFAEELTLAPFPQEVVKPVKQPGLYLLEVDGKLQPFMLGAGISCGSGFVTLFDNTYQPWTGEPAPWELEGMQWCDWVLGQKISPVVAPSSPDSYLSDRHASFLKQLGPTRSPTDPNTPLSLELYFDCIPDALPFQWQTPYFIW